MKLLALHPLPLDGSVFSEELRALADGCVAPALYGCGGVREWARAALDAVGSGPVAVVGNSIGGSCAVEVARLAPTKVRALILVGAKPGHRREPALRDEALRTIEAGGVQAAWERYWRPLFGPVAPVEVVEGARRVAVGLGAEAVADGVRAFHGRPDGEGFLRSWSGPVVVVDGEHDRGADRRHRWMEDVPDAVRHRVGGAGHYVPLEKPDALRVIVSQALTEVRARP